MNGTDKVSMGITDGAAYGTYQGTPNGNWGVTSGTSPVCGNWGISNGTPTGTAMGTWGISNGADA